MKLTDGVGRTGANTQQTALLLPCTQTRNNPTKAQNFSRKDNQ